MLNTPKEHVTETFTLHTNLLVMEWVVNGVTNIGDKRRFGEQRTALLAEELQQETIIAFAAFNAQINMRQQAAQQMSVRLHAIQPHQLFNEMN